MSGQDKRPEKKPGVIEQKAGQGENCSGEESPSTGMCYQKFKNIRETERIIATKVQQSQEDEVFELPKTPCTVGSHIRRSLSEKKPLPKPRTPIFRNNSEDMSAHTQEREKMDQPLSPDKDQFAETQGNPLPVPQRPPSVKKQNSLQPAPPGVQEALKNELGGLLKCSVCHSTMEDPRLLSCAHSFCLTCLRGWVSARPQGDLICPLCKAETPNRNSLSALPKDFRFTSIKDVFEKVKIQAVPNSPTATNRCDLCPERAPAVLKCTDCDKLLCSSCEQRHAAIKVNRSHDTIRLEATPEMTYQNQTFICEEHPGEKAQYFCVLCNQFLCIRCAMDEKEKAHADDLVDFEEGMRHCRDHLAAFRNSSEVGCLNIRETFQQIANREAELKTLKEDNMRTIRSCVETWRGQITKFGDDMMAMVTKQYQSISEEWKKQQMELLSRDQRMQELVDELRTEEVSTGPFALYHSYHKLLSKAKDILQQDTELDMDSDFTKISLSKDGTMLESVINECLSREQVRFFVTHKGQSSAGKTPTDYHLPTAPEEKLTKKQPQDDGYICMEVSKKKMEQIPFNKPGQDDGYTCMEVSKKKIEQIPFNEPGQDEDYICMGTTTPGMQPVDQHQQNPERKRKVSKGSATQEREFFVPKHLGEICPSAVIPMGSQTGFVSGPISVKVQPGRGNFAVCEITNCRVQIFDIQGRSKQLIYHVTPKDFAFSESGEVFIVDSAIDNVSVTTLHNKKKSNWTYPFQKPRCIGIAKTGHVFVADRGRCQCSIHDDSGRLIRMFDLNKSNLKQPCYPVSLSIDSHNRIIISDQLQSTVTIYDPQGSKKLHEILMNQHLDYLSPTADVINTGISLDQHDNIYVAVHCEGKIYQFSPDGKLMTHLRLNSLVTPASVSIGEKHVVVAEVNSSVRHSAVKIYPYQD